MSRPSTRTRPTPFDLVFESAARTTFPAIRSALAASGQDPRDRDAFLMLRDVVELLRELRPEQGLGEGIDQLAALVHHGYLCWNAGGITVELSPDRLSNWLGDPPRAHETGLDQPPHYTQVPEHKIWAEVIPGQAHEPLDGFFQYSATQPGVRRVLGVFGIHPERLGFTVVEVTGCRPPALTRLDGSGIFSPTLPGGAAAGLYSIVGEEELLELAWRTGELASAVETAGWKA
jgi:hypothetical protein